MPFLKVFEVKMEVNDLQSTRDLNFRVELTNIDLCAKFYLPSFTRDFSVPKIHFACKLSLNAPHSPLSIKAKVARGDKR